MGQKPPPERDPIENAKDLARLAARTPDPGAKLWYLEWAKAFKRLALFHETQQTEDGEARKRDDADGDDRPTS